MMVLWKRQQQFSISLEVYILKLWIILCTFTLMSHGIPMISNTKTIVSTVIPSSSNHHQAIHSNTIQRLIKILENNTTSSSDEPAHPTRGLKRVYLSNRNITCNDGSRAGFYLRKYHGSKKWIIFLEGGWYCYDHKSCKNRWMRLRHLMTSTQWPETRDVGGILSANPEENPYWWNANHVFIPYCTSDAWTGTRRITTQTNDEKFNFMGANIIEQTVRDLLPLGLQNATQMLLGGSSAGGTGAMVNLDTVRDLLHDELNLKHIEVRGVIDSGWFLDRAPYAPGIPAVEAIRKGMKLWSGKVPQKCHNIYKTEPWRCYFGYRLYPMLKSPLFVFQWLFDEAQMSVDNVGEPVTKQQWDYIHKMGDSLRHSFENVTALFAPSCISHSVLTKRDWLNVKVDDTSVADALHCWEQYLNKLSPGNKLNDTKANKRRRRRKHKNRNNNNNNNNNRRNHPNKKRKGNGRKIRNENGLRKRSSKNNGQGMNVNMIHDHDRKCKMRVIERCSWPQCNHSCPKLHNPYTGEELDFIELLKSFGLDMDSVALALDIDVNTLNNMDHSELLNLLTQSAS